MLNRITRKIPVSVYKVKYTEEGKEKEVVFESLSGLKVGDVISLSRMYINMYTKSDATIYVSPGIEETPHGVYLYETTILKISEIATLVDVVKKKEE